MKFPFMKNKEITKNIESETNTQENFSSNQQGNFFQKKYLYGVLAFLGLFIFLIIMRKDLFGTNSLKSELKEKNIATETDKSIPDLEADYGEVTDLEAGYGEATEAVYDEVAIEEEVLSQEEQDRLNRFKELEQESQIALRSPTTIAIGSRPQINNNSTVSKQNKSSGRVKDYDGNRQESKKNFLMNEEAQKFYQANFLTESLSEFEMKAGHYIPAIMLTGINSDLPAKIITAVVSENVRDSVRGNNILIPQGTKIIGAYDSSVTFGQERLLVIWQRLILPNGKSLSLDNMQGVDLSGQAGITGDVNNHFGTLLKGVILSSFLGSAGTINASDKFGKDDWRTSALSGAGEQITTIGERFAEKALSRQPTITINPGERFNIIVHSDLILEPYGE